MDFTLGILGIVGGLLCAAGDVLFDLKGKGNVKSGPVGIIDSNWLKMSEWRFRASILLAAAGVPLYLLGLLGMSRQLAQSSAALGTIFLAASVIGSSGGFFIHVFVCCFPLIRKTLTKNKVEDNIQYELFTKLYQSVKIPFYSMFISLIAATSLILIYAILSGHLPVPYVFAALTPLSLMVIGVLFRLINKRLFSDLPGIIMPSIGLAMIGLMTAISACS